MARFVPCPLCGRVHSLRVHAVLVRKVRSAEEAENVDITIISIICTTAKEARKQYSKRILPPFVIPYCQIGREGVLAYLKRFPDGSVVYSDGFLMLGARDMRTIRRHIAMGLATVAAAALELARLLSGLPAYATLPQPRLGVMPGEYLAALVEQVDCAAQRTGGGTASRVPAMVYAHLVNVFDRCPTPLVTPLSYVLRAALFHDTS